MDILEKGSGKLGTVPFIVAFLAAAVLTVFAALFFRPAGVSAEALRCNRE